VVGPEILQRSEFFLLSWLKSPVEKSCWDSPTGIFWLLAWQLLVSSTAVFQSTTLAGATPDMLQLVVWSHIHQDDVLVRSFRPNLFLVGIHGTFAWT
jgi:hypothetical protein